MSSYPSVNYRQSWLHAYVCHLTKINQSHAPSDDVMDELSQSQSIDDDVSKMMSQVETMTLVSCDLGPPWVIIPSGALISICVILKHHNHLHWPQFSAVQWYNRGHDHLIIKWTSNSNPTRDRIWADPTAVDLNLIKFAIEQKCDKLSTTLYCMGRILWYKRP